MLQLLSELFWITKNYWQSFITKKCL